MPNNEKQKKYPFYEETRPALDRFHDSSKVNALVCFISLCLMLYAVCFMLYDVCSMRYGM